MAEHSPDAVVADWLGSWRLGSMADHTGDEPDCPVLAWAASGGMHLTGRPDGAPIASPAPAFGLLTAVARQLTRATGQVGNSIDVDPGLLLTGRAGLLGLHRAGQSSAGGASRLLRTADGWCALTLSRPDDIAAVPAILETASSDEPWTALAAAAPQRTAAALVERAQLLGVPAAVLPPHPTGEIPWRTQYLAPPQPDAALAGALVVDLSSMWAGPLCTHLLGRAGARVIKVESAHRPDGARRGDGRFFDWLHRGQESVTLDVHSAAGRAELRELLVAADVVVEASRPRALAQLALAPDMLEHRAGQIWLSITGYGRDEPMRVAFGDDAAVAGGLVGWDGNEPVFCADAIADPLTGVCAALAVTAAIIGGGGLLLDVSMRAVAAAFAAAPTVSHGPHPVRRTGTQWIVECPHRGDRQPVLPPQVPNGVG